MDALTFCQCILTLATRYKFSVTSWGRTAKRNKSLKGHINSRHLLFCAVDCVLDNPKEQPAFIADAKRMGLKVPKPVTCIHIQTP